MAILGLFGRKKQSKPESVHTVHGVDATAAPDDNASSESYVLSPPSSTLPSLGNGFSDYASSSASLASGGSPKKSIFGFSRKSLAQAPPASPPTRPYVRKSMDGKLSMDKLSLDLGSSFTSSQLKPDFPSFHQASSSPSLSRSSVFDASDRSEVEHAQKSKDADPSSKASGGLFGWRERKKSKPQKPEIVLPPPSEESFNLKAFRHVGPQSTPEKRSESPLQTSPQSLVPPARPRPRGGSAASTDSSQRISVAAFREAQARRSSTNLASASPSPTIRPVSTAGSVGSISDVPLPMPPRARTPGSNSPRPNRNTKSVPGHGPANNETSSEESSEEESESEDFSPSRPRSRLSRQRTVTKRSYRASSDLGHDTIRPSNTHHQQSSSARSELGHGTHTHTQPSPSRGPPPSAFQKTYDATVGTRSFSLYRRQQASLSTSELRPSAAAQRATKLAQANKNNVPVRRKSSESESTSDSSSSSDSSDDDAPLAALQRPAMRNRTTSAHSASSQMRKPLIDLSSKSNPISGKPIAEPAATERERARPMMFSPTNINGRLSKLTAEAGLGNHRKASASKSENNLSQDASASTSTLQNVPNLPSPTIRESITPPLQTSSPEPLTPTVSVTAESPMFKIISTPNPTENKLPVRNQSFHPEASNARANSKEDRLKPSVPLHPTQTSSPSPRPNVITPGIRTSSLSYTSSVFSDSSSSKQVDEFKPVPIKTRSSDDHGFKVVSRPAKANSTTVSPTTTSSDGQSFQGQQRTTYTPGHKHTASSSSIRTQSTISAIKTAPLTAPPRLGNVHRSSSPMSVPGPSRSVQNLQSPSQRPFLSNAKRTDSPGSSTGGSSNGKTPLTPKDGSDYSIRDVRQINDSPSSSSLGATPPSAMKGGRGHVKRASVSFEDRVGVDKDETIRGRRSSGMAVSKADVTSTDERENRRRERRRSEAKAAIDLGNVINGRGPTIQVEDEDDEDAIIGGSLPTNFQPNPINLGFNNMMGWQQQGVPGSMLNGMNPMAGTPPIGMGMGMPQQQFLNPMAMQGADPAFLAAHQQAMLIAKQAYQYAVAQQAMAAAADEWERGSSVSAFTSPNALGMGMPSNNFGMGMNGMWGGPGQMFPGAPRSVYAGSTYGGGMSEAGWGSASVYGEAFGPSTSAAARRSQVFSGSTGNVKTGVAFPGGKGSESANDMRAPPNARNAPRPRTRTAPSSGQPPAQQRNSRVPPSSWKV